MKGVHMTNLSDLGNKEVFAKNLLYYLEYYNKESERRHLHLKQVQFHHALFASLQML